MARVCAREVCADASEGAEEEDAMVEGMGTRVEAEMADDEVEEPVRKRESACEEGSKREGRANACNGSESSMSGLEATVEEEEEEEEEEEAKKGVCCGRERGEGGGEGQACKCA